MLFKKVAQTLEGKRHHLKGKTPQMKVVPNLCANRKGTQENHARGANVPMVGHRGEKTTRVAMGNKFY